MPGQRHTRRIDQHSGFDPQFICQTAQCSFRVLKRELRKRLKTRCQDVQVFLHLWILQKFFDRCWIVVDIAGEEHLRLPDKILKDLGPGPEQIDERLKPGVFLLFERIPPQAGLGQLRF